MVSRLTTNPPAADRTRARLRQPPGAGRAGGTNAPIRPDRLRHRADAAARRRLGARRGGGDPGLSRAKLRRVRAGRGPSSQGGQGAPPLPGGGMRMLATGYTLTRTTLLPFEEAVERVRTELKGEGFGVLCEIDVQATMREKLGVEGEPYLILGACNPPLAHQALQAETELGVLLPCNVIVYERDGETRISAIDAERMLSIVGNDQLASVAAEVKQRLGAVVERACTA